MATKTLAIQTTTNSSPSPQFTLPPPHTFDILPALHELLARIDAFNNQNIVLDDAALDTTNDDLGASYSTAGTGEPVQPLNPKDLPTEALAIKARIRGALRELEKLPDMDRTVEEQNEEIHELQEKIRRQKQMMGRLSEAAKRAEERLPSGK